VTKSTSKSKTSSTTKKPAKSAVKSKAKPASKAAAKPAASKTVASKAAPTAKAKTKTTTTAKPTAKTATKAPAKKATPAAKSAAKAPAKTKTAAKAAATPKATAKAKTATKATAKKAPAAAKAPAKTAAKATATTTPQTKPKATSAAKPKTTKTSSAKAAATPKAAPKTAAKPKASPKAKAPTTPATAAKPKSAPKAKATATAKPATPAVPTTETTPVIEKKTEAKPRAKAPARARRPAAAKKTAGGSDARAAAAGKSDTMKAYMREIGQIPLVTREEEVDLAALIAAGDADARAKLIQSNLRLVVKIAHDFKGLGLPLLDLISEGNIGLMKAVEKFDPSKGAKFSSYAAWWIKQSMRRALSNQSRTIRIPVQSAGKINKIKSARMKLTEELGREPTDVEIANHLEFSERTVASLRLAELRTFSLQDPIQQGEESMFQDIIPDYGTATPDEHISDMEMLKQLKHLIARLDERERLILMMRFGLDGSRPKTLEEVSKIIGRTRERVRQIQNQALTKLRKFIEEDQVHLEQPAEAEV